MSDRKQTSYAPDPESTSVPDILDEDFMYRIRLPENHIVDRFIRFLRFGGIIQRIAEEEGIARERVVLSGRSLHQDHSSNRGRDIHAAHVVRANRVNGNLSRANRDELEELLGHTQNVPQEFNVWRGLGGEIDRFQEQILAELHENDFETVFDSDNTEILLEKYISVLENFIENNRVSDRLRNSVKEAVKQLRRTDVTKLHQKGVDGYTDGYKTKCSESKIRINHRDRDQDDKNGGSNASSKTQSSNSNKSSNNNNGSSSNRSSSSSGGSSSSSSSRKDNGTCFADIAVPLAIGGLAVAGTALFVATLPVSGPAAAIAAPAAKAVAAGVATEAVVTNVAVLGLAAGTMLALRPRRR